MPYLTNGTQYDLQMFCLLEGYGTAHSGGRGLRCWVPQLAVGRELRGESTRLPYRSQESLEVSCLLIGIRSGANARIKRPHPHFLSPPLTIHLFTATTAHRQAPTEKKMEVNFTANDRGSPPTHQKMFDMLDQAMEDYPHKFVGIINLEVQCVQIPNQNSLTRIFTGWVYANIQQRLSA